MLILPTNRGLDWRHFPWATTLLVLLNVCVFVLFQRDDDARYEEAMTFYYDSGLAETEFGLYLDYLTRAGKKAQAQELRTSYGFDTDASAPFEDTRPNDKTANSDDRAHDMRSPYEVVYSDTQFVTQLRNNAIIDDRDPRFMKWRTTHNQFQFKRDQAVGWRFGLIPAEQSPITFLTHQFLHGGTDHLLGNMVFLALIGLPIELAVSGVTLLLAYLLGGALAGLGFAYANPGAIPLVGASGAIAGLMGLYAAIYGLRKIKVFYHFFVYFGYAKLPALVLLPVWIGKEFIFEFWLDQDSNVAYMAHAAGLFAGAALGMILRTLPGLVNRDALNEPERQEKRRSELDEARACMAALNIDKALLLLVRLQREHPSSFEISVMLYRAYRLKGNAESMHKSARRVLLWPTPTGDIETKQRHDIFIDYYQACQNKPQLTAIELIGIAKYWVDPPHTDTATRVAQALLATAQPPPELAELLWLLAVQADRRRQTRQAQKYCNEILARFSASSLAAQARAMAMRLG
jgi:membrane associated rhomboid family serine protease